MSISQNFGNVSPSLLLDFANTKQLDNRITFTRSTPAVYYDGKTTAMAEQNLLLYSQEFDNAAWSKVNSTVTANSTVAPDGTSTADTLTPNTTNGFHYCHLNGPAISNNVQTHSIYVKANGNTKVGLREGAYSGASATFNLTTVAVISQNNAAAIVSNSAITSVGNGWYRISTTYTGAGVSRLELWVLPDSYTSGDVTSFSWAGNGTSGVFLWGAQVQASSTLIAYTATTTQTITNYIPVLLSAGGNQARFDCNPTTGESLGLLIEEQRTNLALYSEDFSYYSGSSSITVNQGIAPNGTQTADLVTGTSDIYQTLVGSSSGTYALSMYVRSITAPYFMLSFGYPSIQRVVFNLSNGSVSSTVGTNITGSSISVGNNWYRLTIVGISQGSILYNQFNAYASTTYNDKTTGALIWGAQLEQGAFPTSYIATTSASATRTADVAQITGSNFSSWFNASEGSVYYELNTSRITTDSFSFNFDNGTSSSDPNFIYSSPVSSRNLFVSSLGSTQVNLGAGVTVSSNTFFKTALGYKNNDFGVSVNGSVTATDTIGVVPLGLARLVLGTAYDLSNANYINGCIRKFTYYPIKVTSTNLQALTS